MSFSQNVNAPPFKLAKIAIEGFSNLPGEFSALGYVKSGAVYYLNKMIKAKKVSEVTISKESNNRFRKYKDGYHMTLNYWSFRILHSMLTSIKSESKVDRSQFADEFFHEIFPRRYKKPVITPKRRITKVIANLDKKIIPYLEPDEIDKILTFFENILKSKYKSAVYKRRLFSTAKIKVDDVALTSIINEFEKLLAQNAHEKKWGEFLKKYLFLLDSRYVEAIPNLNVVLAGSRKVDFGLIDSQKYLDIFEIKRPSTRLLSATTDRGNYYWHMDAVRAIVQAEKYFYNAESKKGTLENDIKRQIGRSVKVTRPRVIVLMGSTTQFDNDNNKEDFRVLRMSLKNVEVVPYDELLYRLRNQKNKVYSE